MKEKIEATLSHPEIKLRENFPSASLLCLLVLGVMGMAWRKAEFGIQQHEAFRKASATLRQMTPISAAKFPVPVLHMVNLKTKGSSKSSDFNSMILNATANLRNYTYVFEGKALYNNAPCDKASVMVHITTPHQTLARGGITDAMGNFRIQVSLKTGSNDPIDYAMEAYTQDFHKVELLSRRVVTQEDSVVTIAGPFAFIPKDSSDASLVAH